jgi:hypothetical protein
MLSLEGGLRFVRYVYGIQNTDLRNKQNTLIPAHVLAQGLEDFYKKCKKYGLRDGTPMHLAHNMHRLIGWSVPVGLLIARDVVAQVGMHGYAEDKEELDQLWQERNRTMQALMAETNIRTRLALSKDIRAFRVRGCEQPDYSL